MHRPPSLPLVLLGCGALAAAPFLAACATQREIAPGVIETRVWPPHYPRALAWPHRAGNLNLDPLGLVPGLDRAGTQIGRGVATFAEAAAPVALAAGIIALEIFFGGNCGSISVHGGSFAGGAHCR